MKLPLRLLACLVCGVPAYAGTLSSILALPRENLRSTAISVVLPANYLCGSVVITSRAKDPAKQADDIRLTLQALIAAAERSPKVLIHQGALRGTNGTGQSLFNNPNGWSTPTLQSTVRLVCHTDGTLSDTFDATRELRLFINGFKPVGECSLQLSALGLAIDSPELQRESLLELIQQQARSLQQRFGGRSSITVVGLDGPVLVRQLDDTNVELFIDYQLSVTVDHGESR